jgi:hypothetical protein
MKNTNLTNKFIDRRNREERQAGLATPIYYWYDVDGIGRRMTCGLAITTAGELAYAYATCSEADHFERRMGRKIVANRIFGRAQFHHFTSTSLGSEVSQEAPESFAKFADLNIPTSRQGVPCARAYHAGQQFRAYRAFMEERAREIIDE